MKTSLRVGSSNAFWAFDLTAQQWHLKRSGVNEGSGYDGGQYSERGVKDPLNYPAARTDHAMTLDEETGNIYICCGTLSQESGESTPVPSEKQTSSS